MLPLRFLRAWQLVAALLVVSVWVLSLTPRPPSVPLPGDDKGAHLIAYAAQMLWLAWILPPSRHALPALAFIAQGVLLELLQALGGVRMLEPADMLANAAGVLTAWALAATPLGGALTWVDARLARACGDPHP
jgi:hypothetical protein